MDALTKDSLPGSISIRISRVRYYVLLRLPTSYLCAGKNCIRPKDGSTRNGKTATTDNITEIKIVGEEVSHIIDRIDSYSKKQIEIRPQILLFHIYNDF